MVLFWVCLFGAFFFNSVFFGDCGINISSKQQLLHSSVC